MTQSSRRDAVHSQRGAGHTAPAPLAAATRALLPALVILALLAGIVGGLLRVGVIVPLTAHAAWPGQAAHFHAAIMLSGFLGTVIAVERAVALKLPASFLAPLLSGAGAFFLLLGYPAIGAWLGVAAAVLFTCVNIMLVQRQRAPHTVLLLVGAIAWVIGNLLFAIGRDSTATLPWWFAFAVLTIGAERLEMTRLMRRNRAAGPTLYATLAVLLGGAAASAVSFTWGGIVYGAALILLAVWLSMFDIARRTVRTHGLSRYMAVCLLSGYFWLAIAGLAWAATATGLPLRDAALHALGLGFIFSMIMGHALVILPAVARIRLRYSAWFYVPLAALHLSLMLRLGGGALDWGLRAAGAGLNALAILVFALTVAAAAAGWHVFQSRIDARAP